MSFKVGFVDEVTIYTLLDDYAGYETSFYAQHGVSFLIKARTKNVEKKILFDVGQSAKPILHNMEILKLDPNDIDMIFLSHNHYDHTGGLFEILSAIGKKNVSIFAHTDILRTTVVKDSDLRNVGLPENTKKKAEELGGVWRFIREPTELMEGVVALGEIPFDERIVFERDIPLELYNVIDGRLVKDLILDDMAVSINTLRGIVVISGCSHAGIIGIIKKAMKLTGNNNVKAVIGGFHLIDAKHDKIVQVSENLKKMKIEHVYAGHCTGLKAESVLLNDFGNKFVKLHSGAIIKLCNSDL